MANRSNLYAEKIYAEHPIALWSLDDEANYISLISEAKRNIPSQWTLTNGTAYNGSGDIESIPFPDSYISRIESTVPVSGIQETLVKSSNIFNFTNLNPDLHTFCIGSYIYSLSPFLQSVSIGYEYVSTESGLTIQNVKTFEINTTQNWIFISETFEFPTQNTNFKIILKFNSSAGGASTSDYMYYVNGITAGQWSEEFNISSLGSQVVTLPADIDIESPVAVVASPYGLSDDIGYYLGDESYLSAKNTSIPMVYGASGITKIIKNANNLPSLIIPGKGFLNNVGRHKEYTFEFWARINSDTKTPKRIFGPIASSDGLYVEGGFLTLVIGDSFKSHFVNEWYRPMLIHIRLIRNFASLLINGEEVLSFAVDTDSMDLPYEFNEDKSQDWLGFYAYDDVDTVEIDAVAIYSYQVPTVVAKRRWVYGQGVESPENINSYYAGTSSFIDYSYANYASNYIYPDFGKWEQGDFDNLTTKDSSLTIPEYQLPNLKFSTKTLTQFYADNKTIQLEDNNFITFKPNEGWDSENSYMLFPKLNMLNEQVDSIYSVIKIKESTESEENILKIYNPSTKNSFSIKKNGANIDYVLTYNQEEEILFSIEDYELDQLISLGIHVKLLSDNFGGDVSTFFGNLNGLIVYVGGDEAGSTFAGNIYSVGFSTEKNSQDILQYFSESEVSGIASSDKGTEILNYTASYTLLPCTSYGKFFLDIGVSGHWEDYMPLSYFGKYIKDESGDDLYDLDFIQFNIGFPPPSKYQETEQVVESWSYANLQYDYLYPVQKKYSELDNFLYSGWTNYQDLTEKSIKMYEFDSTGSEIKTYITLQYTEEGSNLKEDHFTATDNIPANKILDIANHTNWNKTKFEVLDNTLIYPSRNIDFNKLSINYHIDFNLRNSLTKPISLRKLELSSQSFEKNDFNSIGTRFNKNIYPFVRSGSYYDYKAKNPFSIYKGSTPHLYLTKKSGIEIRGDFDSGITRGISMPINESLSANYRVAAGQLWMRYDKDFFPVTRTKVFQINHKGDSLGFYIQANSEDGLRGKIVCVSENTGLEVNGLVYYINGNLVRQPVITIKEWIVLGISFSDLLNFDSFIGSIDLTGPMIFNNISYYQATSLQQIQSTISRPWIDVKTSGLSEKIWTYWLENFIWNEVLVINTTSLYTTDPSLVYNSYIGKNKIVVDDDQGVSLDSDQFSSYSGVVWTPTVSVPA